MKNLKWKGNYSNSSQWNPVVESIVSSWRNCSASQNLCLSFWFAWFLYLIPLCICALCFLCSLDLLLFLCFPIQSGPFGSMTFQHMSSCLGICVPIPNSQMRGNDWSDLLTVEWFKAPDMQASLFCCMSRSVIVCRSEMVVISHTILLCYIIFNKSLVASLLLYI